MNYFELLNVEQKYNVDLNLLQKQYLSKQALYHPDRAKDQTTRTKYLNISMQLNEAYKVLKDDYMRAEYLLKISGQEFNEQVLRNALSTSELEKIMQLYEMLDTMDQLPRLQALKKEKMAEQARMIKELTRHFEANNLAKALDLTVHLKYLTNLVRNIKFKIKHANSRDQ